VGLDASVVGEGVLKSTVAWGAGVKDAVPPAGEYVVAAGDVRVADFLPPTDERIC
jgi:hypothetical protein